MASAKKFRFTAVLSLDSDNADAQGEWQFRAWKGDGQEVQVSTVHVTGPGRMAEIEKHYQYLLKSRLATDEDTRSKYLRKANDLLARKTAAAVGKNKVGEKS